MKNRKLFNACMAGVLSAAMLTANVSVWGAEFIDGAGAQEVAAETPFEAPMEEAEENVELDEELFAADEAGAGEVAISKTYFPDAKFRQYVLDKVDTNKDSKLSAAEIQATTEIDVKGLGIADLKGIEKFTYLKELFASDNSLKTVNLTGNTKLSVINLNNNSLAGTLDLSKCTGMTIIQYSNNALTKVLMPSYKYLKKVSYINASHNKFTTQTYAGLKYIANSYMPKLEQVDVSNNYISSFSCSGFGGEEIGGILDLRNNKITTLSGGSKGYQANAIYLDGKYNTLSKTSSVNFSTLGNRVPQVFSCNSAVKSKVVMVTPRLSVKPDWDKITVTVGSTSDDASYELLRSEAGGSYKTVKTWAAGELDDPEFGENQYVDTNISTGKKYAYKLIASVSVKDANKVPVKWSKYAAKSVYATAGATSISLKSSKRGYATIKWSKVEGADGYAVYYGTKANYAKYPVTNGTTKLYVYKKGLKSGRTYYFRVRAYKNVNGKRVYGPYSSVKGVKIK